MIAAWAGPPLALAFAAIKGRPLRFGTGREYVLAWLLGVMDTARLQFEPRIEMHGLETIETAAAKGRGILVVGTHANAGLARLALRPLDDAGMRCLVISTAAGFPICGNGRMAETLTPSGMFLLAVRTRFRAGMAVCAMLDHVTAAGDVVIRDPLLRVAERCGVPTAFLRARLEGHAVVIDVEKRD
jgi:DNA-binding transcriptional LysR family regulator